MYVHDVLGLLVVGGLAGWIASVLVRGGGLGIMGDIVVGILGAYLGAAIANFFGIITGGVLGEFFMWVLGAVVLLVAARGIRGMLAGNSGRRM